MSTKAAAAKAAVEEKLLTPAPQQPAGLTEANNQMPFKGLQHGEPEDLILPKILLMQGLSKFVSKRGKKPGTFVNSLTMETIADPVFIPILMSKYYDVLKPEGNKMVYDYRVFDKNDARLKGKRFFNSEEGKAEVNGVMSYVSIIDSSPCIITFSKMAYKTGKKLYTLAALARKPLFAYRYELTAQETTNDQGTFYVPDVERVTDASEEEILLAEQLYSTFAHRVDSIQGADQPAAASAEEVPF